MEKVSKVTTRMKRKDDKKKKKTVCEKENAREIINEENKNYRATGTVYERKRGGDRVEF